MKRYILAPQAKEDLKSIRAYLKREAGVDVATSTLLKIKQAFDFLSRTLGAGHLREDLTDEPVKFWSVFSYLIIYDPAAQPIQIARIIHGSREVSEILSQDD